MNNIYAFFLFLSDKNFAESAPTAERRKLRKPKTKNGFRIFSTKCCKCVKTIFLDTSY